MFLPFKKRINNGILNNTKTSLTNIEIIKINGKIILLDWYFKINSIIKTDGISIIRLGMVLNIPGEEIITKEIRNGYFDMGENKLKDKINIIKQIIKFIKIDV